MAAYSANYRIARHLIFRGARRDLLTPEGVSPLKVAVLKQARDLEGILVIFTQK